MTGVQRSIFTPFPKDMCGNPTAYFPEGKLKRWQKKQVIEASLHCSQLAVILDAKRIYKRRLENFKKKTIKKEKGTIKMLRVTRRQMLKYRAESCHTEDMMRKIVTYKGIADTLKLENQKLREKQLSDIEMLVNKNLDDPIPVLKLELEKLEHDNHKQREEISWKDNLISTLRKLVDDYKNGKFTPPKKIDPALREE